MTPELERALDDLRTEFPSGIVRIGITNCRRKNHKDDAPWSEHAWSNAADVHVTNGSAATGKAKKLGDEIAAYMRSRPDLWSEVFWQIPLHYNHVHGTANPRRNPDNEQIPPCAGGPMDYRNVRNVPNKDWAKKVVDDEIESGLIVNDDKHIDDWNAPVTYGVIWTLFNRFRRSL